MESKYEDIEDIQKTTATCTLCGADCYLQIYHTQTGKLIGVEENGCERGIECSKRILMNMFAEPF